MFGYELHKSADRLSEAILHQRAPVSWTLAPTCLTKPVQGPELLAHLRALSRRGVHRASLILTWGPLTLNPVCQQITGQGQTLKLNRKQYQILELFLH